MMGTMSTEPGTFTKRLVKGSRLYLYRTNVNQTEGTEQYRRRNGSPKYSSVCSLHPQYTHYLSSHASRVKSIRGDQQTNELCVQQCVYRRVCLLFQRNISELCCWGSTHCCSDSAGHRVTDSITRSSFFQAAYSSDLKEKKKNKKKTLSWLG